jgi:mono/diheme cytochrome c family protein
MFHRVLPLSAALIAAAAAQDGGQLYTTYCSACHGPDGQGATGGAFPPLAGSPWVQGDAERAIKIVLHGLHGPIDVFGRTYNLEMPPQGAVIPDDQIAAILSHVRASWGNTSPAVSPDMVKAARAATADRKTPWTAPELLKLHPLPATAPPIAKLTSRIYHGDWTDLPDFSKLQARNIEEENDGLIDVSHGDREDLFALVWEGEITAPEAGTFTFRLDADDGARVLVKGRLVTEVAGIGPFGTNRARNGSIELEAGAHPIRIEYLEYKGQQDIALAMKGPGIKGWRLLSKKPVQPEKPKIMIAPAAGRAVVYRNFIDGVSPRAIGFGFPGGVNLAYDADRLAPALIWTGDFMDGSRHWIERGQGNQPPAGERVVKLSAARALPPEARFRGYKLDAAGNPTFSSQLGKRFLLDAWKPGASAGSAELVRTLTLTGEGASLELPLADQLPARPAAAGVWQLGDAIELRAENAAIEIRDGKAVLKLASGQPVTLTYRWK